MNQVSKETRNRNRNKEQEQMEWTENGNRKWDNCKQELGTEKGNRSRRNHMNGHKRKCDKSGTGTGATG